MFATTSRHAHWASFSELFDSPRVISAQPRCIFGNRDDAVSSHTDARCERLRWMLFAHLCFCGALVACVSQEPGGSQLREGGEG